MYHLSLYHRDRDRMEIAAHADDMSYVGAASLQFSGLDLYALQLLGSIL